MPNRKTTKVPAAAGLLVELLTEELPPNSLKILSAAFGHEVLNGLVRHQLKQHDTRETRVFATPRRLGILIPDVLAKAGDRETEVTGPSAQIGLDPEGKPTPALVGFARKNGVAVATLEQRETAKGKVFVARVKIAGSSLDGVLERIVGESLRKLPISKVMRWGDGDAQFVRPAHGLVMMHGKRVVPGAVLGLSSHDHTLGHRFLSKGRITIPAADQYESVLEKEGVVIASFAKRKERVQAALEKAAAGAKPLWDDALLDEVTALVEHPVVYAGAFSDEFLALPQECLVLSMKQHQRYFPLADAKGKLLPRFLVVSNLAARNPGNIIHGNERVLRARLADAKFFYDQDRKTRLEERVPRLAKVVYHNKLGTQLERTERVQLLANKIARNLGADATLAGRAAWLAKADLLTGMVGEFPELQGIMGRYYALHDGEPKEVADGIEAHYRPRYAGDRLPEGGVACAVALADKLEVLAGMFGVGQQPSGDKDPFALRRHALGAIRILVEGKLQASLTELVNEAYSVFPPGMVGDAHTDLVSFIFERLRGYLRDAGYTANEIESVLCMRPVRLLHVPLQLAAVRAFAGLPEAESLAAANKRVANILKQAEAKGESFNQAQAHEMREPADRNLFDALKKASRHAIPLFETGDYAGYLKAFAVLKSPVDVFFDSVMVMADDPEIRKSRLALLTDLRDEMNRVADISKLAVEK